jgi:AraC-like DNA-binding protein
MILKDFPPNPAFNAYVQNYRIVHFIFDTKMPIPVKAYAPIPEQSLIFFLRDTEQWQRADDKKMFFTPSITLNGQQTFTTFRQPGHEILLFNIIFQPTGLFHLTGIPAHDFRDKTLDAATVFDKEIQGLKEQLQNATSYTEMIGMADKFIAHLVNRAKNNFYQVEKVSQFMLRQNGNISLDYLAKEAFLSTKQFKRKFYEQTGVNPKEFSRIIRFHKACSTKNKCPHLDWLTIAMNVGYYDYQHLVKDFKDFTGLTPNAFYLLENKSPEKILSIQFEQRG